MSKTDRTWEREMLQELNKKLDQHAESLATLIAESKHAKELTAELREKAQHLEAKVSNVKVTMARWAGIAAGIVGVSEAFFHLVK